MNKLPLREIWSGLMLAILIGLTGYGARKLTKSPAADPLLIALMLGIFIRSITGKNKKFKSGFTLAPTIFIPVGIVFYAMHNLNFAKLAEVEKGVIPVLITVMIAYFAVILFLGKLLGQRNQITYLTAIGSAICGASAIAVTSPAVEAEPEDISISLLSVALAALVGFSLIIPFFSALFNLTCNTHCVLSGSVLQFTGLVKMANSLTPYIKDPHTGNTVSVAISIKAARYLGLLVAIPLFSSLIKKKLYVPWYLWAFLASGLLGTWIYVEKNTYYHSSLIPYIKPIHNISWSIAMAAIGLNTNVKALLSNNGTKSIFMAFGGLFAAILTFFVGLFVLRSL